MQTYKLLISLALLGYGTYIFYQRVSIELQPVSAVVTQSHREFRIPQPDRPGRYHHTFAYAYTYLDQDYVSEQYRYGNRDTAEAVCRYRVGDPVIAYVDPNNPRYAVIDRNISGLVYALTGLGGLMLIQTLMTYVLNSRETAAPTPLKQAQSITGVVIGMTVLFGGIGYFVYILIVVGTTQCVN